MNAATAAPEVDWTGRVADDADLVAAVRAGDEGAFAELYRRHQPSVARFVRGRVRDHGRAEDVVQEAFVSALRRMRQTDSPIMFRAWIFEIARNAAIDLYRRTSRAEEVSFDVIGAAAPADASQVSGSPGPETSLLRSESFNNFRGALDELSETHTRIIVMRELEGRSYREIGERMKLSQAAVESTLFRARRKLEHEYEQLDSGRRCRLVAAAIGRLAEGMESRADRVCLDRHARRCSACRRRARQLGVEPIKRGRAGIVSRAAAFLPLPGFLRRRSSPTGSTDVAAGPTIGPSVSQMGIAFAPSAEVAGGIAAKAAAVIAAVVVIGGGGITLGGKGPLAVGGQGVPEVESLRAEPAAPSSPPLRFEGVPRPERVAPPAKLGPGSDSSPPGGSSRDVPAAPEAPSAPRGGEAPSPGVPAPGSAVPAPPAPPAAAPGQQAPEVPVTETAPVNPVAAPGPPPSADIGAGSIQADPPPAPDPDAAGLEGASLAGVAGS